MLTKQYTIDQCGAALSKALRETTDFDCEQQFIDYTLEIVANFKKQLQNEQDNT